MTATAIQPDLQADPRTFARIKARDLIIDSNKQRDVDMEKAAKIANEWDWKRVECLTVVKAQTGGKFDVIEGQHRSMAAGMINPDLELPCMILPGTETDQEQSQVALDIVQGRRGHSAYAQWQLRLHSGHPHEVMATAMLDELRLRLGKAPSAYSIGAVATVRRIFHGGNFSPEIGTDLLRKTLVILLEAWPTYDLESNISRWDRWLLLAVSKIVLRYPRYDQHKLAVALRTRPAIQWINAGKGFDNLTPDEAIIQAVKPVYNKGRRKERFSD